MIPNEFQSNLSAHFGNDISKQVLEALREPASVSVRYNPSKTPNKRFEGTAISWAPSSIKLESRPNFALDPLFHAGCYYVQDASSMVLEAILDQLDLPDGALAMDLCAAPGGKSLILSDRIKDSGMLISNEIDGKRNAILRENILKWGCSNTVVTQLNVESFVQCNELFDLVLIDAPCSGEGMFRKDAFAIEQWSSELVDQCSVIQAHLLESAKNLVKPGGYLIYSTCTMNVLENEDQVRTMLDSGFNYYSIELGSYSDYIIPAKSENETIGYYLLPGISMGEGLFISVMQRTGASETIRQIRKSLSPISQDVKAFVDSDAFTHEWQSDKLVFALNDPHQSFSKIPDNIRFKSVGIAVAERKGKLLIPSHGAAMHPSAKPDVELNMEEALNYLRKDRISASPNSNTAWQRVGFEENCLGWVKHVPGRWNNYYPSQYRLRI